MSKLDFRRTARRPLPAPRPSRLLFYLILSMGVVVILADWARRPQSWRWLDRLSVPAGKTAAAPIDNRLPVGALSEAPADGFIIPQNQSPSETDADRREAATLGMTPAQIKAIRDDAVASRAEEARMLAVFAALEKTPDATLKSESLGLTSYAQLYRQPAEYRGRVVSVSGVVRRVNRLAMLPNNYGLPEHFYQVWLFPDDNPSAPLVACCLRLPPGFPTGLKVEEQAEVTGVFFKRWPYEAADGLRTAPTLLAKTLQWRRPAPLPEQQPVNAGAIPWVVLAAVGLTLLTTLWIYWRTKPPRPKLPDAPPDFSALETTERESENTNEK
jgi:hypothetical protein